MTTVAEVIETHKQADIVRSLCCDKGHGYLFSRPVTVADIELWLEESVARKSYARGAVR